MDDATPRVRCALVVCDPALAASQPEEELAASALNALAHAAEAPCTVGANPVSTLAAHEAARLIVGAYGGAASRTATRWRSARCSRATRWTRRATGCTTCSRRRVVQRGLARARAGERGAAPAHAGGARPAPPRQAEALADALGQAPAAAAAALCERTGATRLRDLGIDGGGARRVRRHRGRAPAARRHAAPRGPRGDPRALRRRLVTRGQRSRRRLRARTGVTILWAMEGGQFSASGARRGPGPASSRPPTRAPAARPSTASRSSRGSCAGASSPPRPPGSRRWTPTRCSTCSAPRATRSRPPRSSRWTDVLEAAIAGEEQAALAPFRTLEDALPATRRPCCSTSSSPPAPPTPRPTRRSPPRWTRSTRACGVVVSCTAGRQPRRARRARPGRRPRRDAGGARAG